MFFCHNITVQITSAPAVVPARHNALSAESLAQVPDATLGRTPRTESIASAGSHISVGSVVRARWSHRSDWQDAEVQQTKRGSTTLAFHGAANPFVTTYPYGVTTLAYHGLIAGAVDSVDYADDGEDVLYTGDPVEEGEVR